PVSTVRAMNMTASNSVMLPHKPIAPRWECRPGRETRLVVKGLDMLEVGRHRMGKALQIPLMCAVHHRAGKRLGLRRSRTAAALQLQPCLYRRFRFRVLLPGNLFLFSFSMDLQCHAAQHRYHDGMHCEPINGDMLHHYCSLSVAPTSFNARPGKGCLACVFKRSTSAALMPNCSAKLAAFSVSPVRNSNSSRLCAAWRWPGANSMAVRNSCSAPSYSSASSKA